MLVGACAGLWVLGAARGELWVVNPWVLVGILDRYYQDSLYTFLRYFRDRIILRMGCAEKEQKNYVLSHSTSH